MSAAPTPFQAGLRMACPVCGQGKLYQGLLTIAPACNRCGQSFERQDSGDGPAYFVIVGVGVLVGALMVFVERSYQPPLWVHLALWLPLILGLSIAGLRIGKAWLIALQFRHRREDFA